MSKNNLVYVRTDKNGTKIYHDYTCPRCGGAGGADQWTYTGWTCYECGGTGRRATPRVVKEYTPEYEAKLNARRIKRQEKARAERLAEIKANPTKHLEEKGFNEAGKVYVAVGNTYEIKEELKEAGAKWSSHFHSWVFKEDPTEFDTVELTAEECLEFNELAGYLAWKNIDFKELIQSKLPKEDTVVSEYVGEIGERLEVEVTFTAVFHYERTSYTGWGTDLVSIYKFTDDNGNIFIWNTTACPEVEAGVRYQIKGTVAEHSEYRGEKQTVLKRCKINQLTSKEV